MADSDTTSKSVDTTQQVTSQTPAIKQENPKRVAAGKAIAERTRIAREAQKKALIKAESMIARKLNQRPQQQCHELWQIRCCHGWQHRFQTVS